MTPAGTDKSRLKADELVILDASGKRLQGQGEPSSEASMHLFVYQRRPDIFACLHAHPPHATAFAVAGLELPVDILPEGLGGIGKIPLTDYAPPGTGEIARSLEPWIEKHAVFLLRNHGLLAAGTDIWDALHKLETVEHVARVAILARQLGEAHRLPSDEMERLEHLRRRTERAWEAKRADAAERKSR